MSVSLSATRICSQYWSRNLSSSYMIRVRRQARHNMRSASIVCDLCINFSSRPEVSDDNYGRTLYRKKSAKFLLTINGRHVLLYNRVAQPNNYYILSVSQIKVIAVRRHVTNYTCRLTAIVSRLWHNSTCYDIGYKYCQHFCRRHSVLI